MQNLDKPSNQLLAALSQQVYQRLYAYLEPVKLTKHEFLYHSGETYDYAYFPTHSVISIVSILDDGSTTEIGVIGNEGMIGLPIILNTNCLGNLSAIVQVDGGGQRIAASRLREELDRRGELQRLLMRYVQAQITQVGQTAACNRHHNIEQRFARWLLMVNDSIGKEAFYLTQEFTSQMLGVRRSGVSQVASKLQEANIICYSRGLIKIIDRQKLEAACCECYKMIANEYNRLLKNF